MKFCIFSDIHGNSPAFNTAYKMIIAEDADVNIFLGDLCGYYYDQLEIFDKLITIPKLVAIQGNHDSMFLSMINGNNELRQTYRKRYGNSMEYLLNNYTAGFVKWLSELPKSYFLSDIGLSCYHGSPWNVMEGYVYPDSRLEQFHEYSSSCFFLGHTHYSMVRNIGNKLILNPGSLGQPRNGIWPTYAVIDRSSMKVAIKEVVYDKTELVKRIDEIRDDNQYLRKILDR